MAEFGGVRRRTNAAGAQLVDRGAGLPGRGADGRLHGRYALEPRAPPARIAAR